MFEAASPTRIRLTLPALALLAACGDDRVASRALPITDGKEDHDHVSVGYLAGGSGVGCTGTVVGRRTVLTAAHCISGGDQTFVLDGSNYLSSSSTVHPKYDPVGHNNDIALLRLKRSVHLVPSRLEPKSRPAGTTVTLVGYGATSEDGTDSGTRRVATNSIASLHTTSFNIKGTGGGMGNACNHDSGGPVFVEASGVEAQLGVLIGGVPPCGNIGIAMRVDTYLVWLRSASFGDLAVQGETGTTFGMPCADGKDCASGICLEDQASGDKFCSVTCAGQGGQCPEGGACAGSGDAGQTVCHLPSIPEIPDEEGGCAVGEGRPHAGAGAALLLTGIALLLILLRREADLAGRG